MILQALNRYYDRRAAHGDVPSFGYSDEPISFAVILSPDGSIADINDLRAVSGRKSRPTRLEVPQPVKRTSGLASNFLWDKAAYVLGVGRDKNDRAALVRTPSEHETFKSLHRNLMEGVNDDALIALLRFLDSWSPDQVDALRYREDVPDGNLVFRLDGEGGFLHDRRAAQEIWARALAARESEKGFCLVTGKRAPIARLHPSVKGVGGAQSSGASLVSFNLDAFTSYGKDQGANAPASEHAAFAYAAALNSLLRRSENNRHRLQIADASTVFWAEAAGEGSRSAELVEGLFATLVDPPTDAQEAAKIRPVIEMISKGQPLEEIDLDLHAETRMFVLGLSPNAARLSIRFWHVDSFGTLAERLRQHWRDLEIEPRPWTTAPAVWRLLVETAAQRKAENVPSNLAGEVMRAILTGRAYPRTLFSAVVGRCRADRDLNGMRAAILKAYLVRQGEEVPMGLDRNEINAGYRLGRLFAVLQAVQRAALGSINASIRDRFYGAASATPAAVFPILLRTAGHHLSTLRKGEKTGRGEWFEREMSEIMDGFESAWPRYLRLEDQGRFAIGYYHEREALYRRKGKDVPEDPTDAD